MLVLGLSTQTATLICCSCRPHITSKSPKNGRQTRAGAWWTLPYYDAIIAKAVHFLKNQSKTKQNKKTTYFGLWFRGFESQVDWSRCFGTQLKGAHHSKRHMESKLFIAKSGSKEGLRDWGPYFPLRAHLKTSKDLPRLLKDPSSS